MYNNNTSSTKSTKSFGSGKKKKKQYGNKSNSFRNKSSNRPQQRGGGFKKSTLDPNLLVRKATEEVIVEYESKRTIKDLPIDINLIECLVAKGFSKPTQIQDQTLEYLLDGHDVLGIAQTGSGKTAAFLVPIIQELLQNPQKSYALVVVPTRELASQIQDEFISMSKGLNLYSECFIGGTNINTDIKKLRRSQHIIIGTPGRLLDLIGKKLIDLRKFNTLVLDEFDRMLDMGFIHDMKKIIGGMENRKHSLLFSATLDKTQQSLIDNILSDYKTVKCSNGETTCDHIDQDIIHVGGGDKFKMLCDMLYEKEEFSKVLVFEETKHKVKRLCQKLEKIDITADQIHGNKSQNARQNALNKFKKGKIQVLVATDVAARGIDVSDVTHVINYQIPLTMDSYIHRIGRTGRAGKRGKAFTFVD